MSPTAMTLRLAAIASSDQMSRAVEIAAIGMLLVFTALAVLTVFLVLLPRLLAWLNRIWPEPSEHHAAPAAAEELLGDEDDVLAAIGFVLHITSREQP